MGRIDLRWLRAARLAGATLVAVGAFDVVLRGHSLSRDEDGAILLAAGAALLALHVVLARRGGRDSTDALLCAALAVPFIPAGVALLVYSPPSAASLFASGGDILSPVRDAASAGLLVAALAFAGAYALTRHPRWVLVVALAVGFGAELQSSAPIPIFFGTSTDSWTPAVILTVAAAVAVGVAVAWKAVGKAERRNLVVAAAIMLVAAAEARAFGGSADAGRDLFLAGLLAAGVAIAWWRATPGIAVAIIFTGGVLTLSLSQRSGYFGVGAVLVGAALAGGATFWSVRSANGGGPPALPPAPAA
jgi:hypothetical protein